MKRGTLFEEGLAVLRQLWTEGKTTFHGTFLDYDEVSFYSGTEMGPLMPIQKPPPIWVVSNPRLKGDAPPDVIERRLEAACRRIVSYGDGWLTCCRAQHPEEFVEQLRAIERYADEHGEDFSRLVISYQVTMNIGKAEDEARLAFDDYISKYYRSCRRRWTCRTGAGRHAGPDRRMDPDVRRGRRGPLHLPVRRDRPVRAGRAVRKGSAAPVFCRESEVTMATVVSDQLLEDAALVVDECFSVEDGDVVTIICDDDREDEARAVAEVCVERGAWPVIMNNELQVRRGRADVRFPMAPRRTCTGRWSARTR